MKTGILFESPKVGEKILEFDVDSTLIVTKTLFVILMTLWIIVAVIFEFNLNTFLIGSGIGLVLWFILSMFVLFSSTGDKSIIKEVFYFDEYLVVNNTQVAFDDFDNFLEKEEGKINTCVRFKQDENFYHLPFSGAYQTLKTNKKYKKASLELINFLNSKVSHHSKNHKTNNNDI